MPSITTQSDARRVQRLDFCYLCGQKFSASSTPVNLDHVPPAAIFAKEDRNWPLKLSVHVDCNSKMSESDEVLGQLVAVLHGSFPNPSNLKLQITQMVEKQSGDLMGGVTGIPIESLVWRCLKGFHAALYCEPAQDCGGYIWSPFPRGFREGDEVVIRENSDQRALWTMVVKKARAATKLDEIICNNGKCRYACVWDRLDDGRSICVFGFRLYDWENLGHYTGTPRGCVGYYIYSRPKTATCSSPLHFNFANESILDPFGN